MMEPTSKGMTMMTEIDESDPSPHYFADLDRGYRSQNQNVETVQCDGPTTVLASSDSVS